MRAGICTTKEYRFSSGVRWMARLGVRGAVIGRHVLFSENCPGKSVFRHELEHAYQMMRDGRVVFYLKYFYYSLRYGYARNPYEVEARQRASEPLTENEEHILWKLREG